MKLQWNHKGFLNALKIMPEEMELHQSASELGNKKTHSALEFVTE
jgi:hypothetical protein